MSMSQETEGWDAWLGRLRPERAVCAFASELEAAHESIERFALSTTPQTIVVHLEWPELPRLNEELEGVAQAFSRAVLLRWPALYGAPFRADPEVRPREILDAARATPLVSVGAAQRIVESCGRGEAPRLERYHLAERVRQLTLALEPARLLVVLTSHARVVGRDRAIAFARGAEWIAGKTQARVVALLTRDLSSTPDFDHISYGAFHDWQTWIDEAPAVTPLPPETDGSPLPIEAETSPVHVALGAILGQPHPGSAAERLLHARITADAELRELFHYNQVVPLTSGRNPRVDLLWPARRLVVEIDGIDHQRLGKFVDDRRRDLDLLMHGYTVVRFSSYDVECETDTTLRRLRDLVNYVKEEKESIRG